MANMANMANTATTTMATGSMGPNPAPGPQVTEVYDKMRGFLKGTHWSKPYYSSLVHNNPQLPYHLLEHVNCTYLSTPGRAPTLLALKQHAQSLAVLISLLAPSQYGGTFDGKTNADAPFAAEQAFDWLNDMQAHYHTDDGAHKKPLNALINLVKSNNDTEGPKWHCPLDTTEIEHPENHPFQQYRPYESHLTLLMHANEILERLDHEYSAMGGILSLIPLDSDNVDEQRALKLAKTTLVGQWILYTQHLVVRMHELEIAYGNSLDLLANEAIVPMQHISVHGPDGRSGREIVFPQDRWILANAGEDVFTFIHQMLDRAEAHQDARDAVFAEQNVLGDAAFSSNDDAKFRGIVKVDLNTRFYRLRNSGHGPLFVLPAFGDRPNTKHTRDIEDRPTVVTIPQPTSKEAINSWEAKHKDIDVKMLKLAVDKSNLEAKVSSLNSSVEMRDREIERLNELQKQYTGKINDKDQDLAKQVVHLQENIKYFQKMLREAEDRENALKSDIDTFKAVNVSVQSGEDPTITMAQKINDQENEMRALRKSMKEQEKKMEDVQRDNDTLRILQSSPLNPAAGGSGQVAQLQTQLASCQQERQMLQQEVHNLKKAKMVKGKILNFPEGFTLDYGSTFEDSNLGITACSTTFHNVLLAAENERNILQQRLDNGGLEVHTIQTELDRTKAKADLLQKENEELKRKGGKPAYKYTPIINLPWGLQYASTFRDDNQGLIVLNTEFYDHLVAIEQGTIGDADRIAELEQEVKSLRTPAEARLSDALVSKVKTAKVYKDTNRQMVICTFDHYDQLENSEKAKNGAQQQQRESDKNVQTLQKQLKEVRDQLEECLKRHREGNADLPNLQNQIDELRKQLDQALARNRQLEGQITILRANTSANDVRAQAADLQEQLDKTTRKRDKREGQLRELQTRHDQLRLNENNLRTEVASLRKQLSDAARKVASTSNAAVNTTPAPVSAGVMEGTGAGGNEQLRSAREEIQLYRSELETVQRLWNDLQTEHVKAQTALERARQDCEEEKAALNQRIRDLEDSIKALQMKVLANPNMLNPVVIELEAQRDAARKHRDELQEQLRALQRQ